MQPPTATTIALYHDLTFRLKVYFEDILMHLVLFNKLPRATVHSPLVP